MPCIPLLSHLPQACGHLFQLFCPGGVLRLAGPDHTSGSSLRTVEQFFQILPSQRRVHALMLASGPRLSGRIGSLLPRYDQERDIDCPPLLGQDLLLDAETALLENLVAITLLRKYGREDAVFFYNRNIEVDFYLPDEETAIQVCYSLSDAETVERETKALVSLSKVLPCKELLIITRNEERNIETDGKQIRAVPIWRWLLEE